MPAFAAGERLLGRGLSDLAAMGAEPRLVFLNLALSNHRPRFPERWIQSFVAGFSGAARRFGASLAGGDVSSTSGPFVASVTALGETPQGAALLRSGARPGDLIYVTGTLGCASKRIFPRVEVGRWLRRKGVATAAIDLSDGLSTDLNHLARASGVGALVEGDRAPRRGQLARALTLGEDYELLFTARPTSRVPDMIAGVRVTRIGTITAGRRVTIRVGTQIRPLTPSGWEHFRSVPSSRQSR